VTLTVWDGHPGERLAQALGRFEAEFSYPLGDDGRFHIEHDGDAWRFFHALGDAAYAVVESGDRVLGVLGAALRHVIQPDGVTIPLLYLGDLKIAASARSGLILIRLARAIQARFVSQARGAFAVVMDGTSVTPSAYSGRLGIPAFRALHAVSILWLRTATGATPTSHVRPCDSINGIARFTALAAGQYLLSQGEPRERSLMTPQWLLSDDGGACGRIEDTLRAKRLRSTTGENMRSAHLSCFAYRSIADGTHLLTMAAERAAQNGYPMLFAAVAADDAAAMAALLGGRLRSVANATVFGSGLETGRRWNINTAEI